MRRISVSFLAGIMVFSLVFPPQVFGQIIDASGEVTQAPMQESAFSIDTPSSDDGNTRDTDSNVSDVSGNTANNAANASSRDAATPSLESRPQDGSGSSRDGRGDTKAASDPPYSTVQPTADVKQIKPDVDLSSGALTYRYPINLPPGRNGFTPELSLVYNSQDRSDGSLVGYGWNLSIPYIQRENKWGNDEMYNTSSQSFSSSLDGPLAHISGDEYGPKVDSGSFNMYTHTGGLEDAWKLETKTGETYWFGTTTEARQFLLTATSTGYLWMLDRMQDADGNKVKFIYSKDQGQVYINKIEYVYSPLDSNSSIFSLNFIWEDRSDIHTSFYGGFKEITQKRLKTIKIEESGSVSTGQYDFSYVQDSVNDKSLLSEVVQSGFNGSATTTLPATSFSYTPNILSFDFDSIDTDIYELDYTDGVIVTDVNADSYADVLQSSFIASPSTEKKKVWFNTGNFTTRNSVFILATSTYSIPNIAGTSNPVFVCTRPISSDPCDAEGVAVFSIRGDLANAFVRSPGPATTSSSVYMNTGSGWSHSSLWDEEVQEIDPLSNSRPLIADINGDSLPDHIRAFDSGGNAFVVHRNTGLSMESISISSETPDYFGLRMADMNHDGLNDVYRAYRTPAIGYDIGVFINTTIFEEGFVEDTEWVLPSNNLSNTFENSTNGITQALLADLNGDDFPDFISDSQGLLYLNDGYNKSFTTTTFTFNAEDNNGRRYVGDVNGDGLLDVIYNLCNSRYPNCITFLYLNTGKIPDLLSQITLPTGGEINVAYKASPQYKSGNTLLNAKLPITVQTVQAIGEYDSVMGVVGTTTYEYAGGSYYFNDPHDRKFAGFETVTQTRPDGSKRIDYFHQGNSSNSSNYEYQDFHPKIGKSFRTDSRDAGDNLMVLITNKIEEDVLSSEIFGDRFFVYPLQTITETYDGNGTHRDIATTFAFNATNGNLTEQKEWGEITASDPLNFTDIGADTRTSVYEYASSTANTIELRSREVVKDNANAIIADQKITYDNLPFGEVGAGNPTKKEYLIEGTTYASTTHAYNSFGLMLSERDPNANETTYVYDPFNLYVATSTNALGHETESYYDYSSGKPIQTIAPNGEIYETAYDALDRVITQKTPHPADGSLVTTKTITYTNTPNQYAVHETNNLSASVSTDAKTYVDGFGRVIQTRTRAEDNGGAVYAVRDTLYDKQGRVAKESLPYFSADVNKTSPTSNNNLYTLYVYDAVGRATDIGNVFGTTTIVYDDWYATTTDVLNNKKTLERDAFQRLKKVDEYGSSAPSPYATTTYNWDALGNLKKITDASGNIRNFEYDMLGRRTFAEDLHHVADTQFGSTTYSYDLAGNLIKKVKPDNVVVAYAYDDLNRILNEDASSGSGLEAEYTYDACSQGVGRLCVATTTTITAGKMVLNNRYNYAGNISKETKTIDGNVYLTDYTYDYLGNPLTIKNPNDALITYEYNNAGHPEAVYWKESGVATTTIVSDFDYAPTGDITTQTNTNGTTVTNTYDADALYRLKQKSIDNGTQTLQQFLYDYDKVGNITHIVAESDTATLPNHIADYTYDSLYRLTGHTFTSSSSPSSYTESFTYDGIGNIVTSPQGSYFYQGTTTQNFANPHAATKVGAETLTYDKNGNLVNRTGNLTHTWDYNNRLVKIKLPSQQTSGFSSQSFGGPGQPTKYATYGYDTGGMRVYSHITNSATTSFAFPSFSKEYTAANATTTEHISVNGVPVATIVMGTSNPVVSWNSQDHLRSTSLVTDDSANITEEVEYRAFGSLNNDIGTTIERRKYTGHEHDIDALSYTYAKARYLNTDWGRFLSEDPAFLALGDQGFENRYGRSLESFLANPQELNSYSYVMNNSLRYTDPSGEVIFTPAFLPLIGKILTYFGAANFGVSLYDYKIKNYNYPDQFSQQEKTSAANQVKIGGLTIGLGFSNVLSGSQTLLLDTLTTSLDLADQAGFGSQIYKNVGQKNDINKPSVGVSIGSTYQQQLDQIYLQIQQIQNQLNYLQSLNSQ